MALFNLFKLTSTRLLVVATKGSIRSLPSHFENSLCQFYKRQKRRNRRRGKGFQTQNHAIANAIPDIDSY